MGIDKNSKINFSIIIPTFNVAKIIERSIKSIIQQTYKRFEIIIVDGASTDNTCPIVKRYQNEHKNIILISEPDQGIYDAMNKGIDASSGNWLYFMGADDVLFDENIFQELFDSGVFDENKVVYGNVRIEGNNNWAKDNQIYDGKFDLKKLLQKNICQQAMFYPRRVFKEYGLFDLKFPVSSDWIFNLKIFSKEVFVFIDQTIAVFATGGKSTFDNTSDSYLLILEEINDFFQIDFSDPSVFDKTSPFSHVVSNYLRIRFHTSQFEYKNQDGISIIIAIKNRVEHFEQSLQTWLSHSQVNEIVVVDWSSDEPISPIIKKYQDGRIRLVEVKGQSKWNLAMAYNLAARFTSFDKILKIDADIELLQGFFEEHKLTKNHFFTGSWEKSRNENETHLNGSVFLFRNDFFKVNGYSEYISTYGWDDSDLYIRLEKMGMKRLIFNFDSLHHIEHPVRMQHQESSSVFPIISDEEWSRLNILTNRHLCRKTALWGLKNEMAPYDVVDTDTNKFVVETTQLDKNKIPLHIREEAFQVAIRERLLELIPDFEPDVFAHFNNESLNEIYRSFLTESVDGKNNLYQVFKHANALLLKNRHEKDDLLIEKNQQLSELEIQRNTVNNMAENVTELEKLLSEKANDLELKRAELGDSKNQLHVQNETIEKLNQQLLLRENEVVDRQHEIEAFKNSITYKVIQLLAIIFLIFKPRLIIKKIKTRLLIAKQTKIIQESRFFDSSFYLKNYPDVAKSRMRPAKHYLLHGGFEGRNPSQKFNSNYYLTQNEDVCKAGLNPLLHFVLYGQKEGRTALFEQRKVEHQNVDNSPIEKEEQLSDTHNIADSEIKQIIESGLFDNDYYYEQYSDIRNASIDGLKHYFEFGWKEGRNPNRTFDTFYYLESNQDVKESGINPLLHYIIYGKDEGRPTNYKINVVDNKVDSYEEARPLNIKDYELSTKVIAFHLPQFHTFKENNEWWGEGFTEWTNVTKAKPQYDGHYQPRLPGVTGFYDLSLPEVLAKQAQMAKQFGIYGFCFHHYYFAGKRLMEIPVNNLLAHPEIDLPFCLCWANENWTRRWDGLENDILIAQDHSPDDDIRFLNDIEKYFLDPRYIRVDNKPLFIIYKANQFPDMKATINRWRSHWRTKWDGELHIVMALTFGETDPLVYGFDAAVEFPPHNIGGHNITSTKKIKTSFEGEIFSYEDFMTKSLIPRENTFELYKTVFPAWDNTARRGNKANIYADGSASHYKYWLSESIKYARTNLNLSSQFVFINAWNEWAEAAYLEPCQKLGYCYLNATARALEERSGRIKTFNSGSLLFVSHDAFKAGGQLVLLDTVKWLSMNTQLKLKVLFLAGGELEKSFSNYAETLILKNFSDKSAISEIRNFIDGNEDLIYMNSVVSGRIIKALSSLNIPILMHIHELQKSIEVYANEYIEDVIQYANHFIACSKAVSDYLQHKHHIHNDRISLVHSYVNNEVERAITREEKDKLKRELNVPLNKKIIVGVGLGLFWRKGVDLFVDVCCQLKKQAYTDDYLFIWIGECFANGNVTDYGTWSDQLERIKELELENRIHFTGTLNNVRDYLQASDLFLLPSREDPFPLVCLEAADCYLPIICFDEAGGMPELVKDDAGFVVPFEDTKEMANKTIHLLSNEHERVERGKIAHQRFVEHFSVKASLGKILHTIQSVGNINPLVSNWPNINQADLLESHPINDENDENI